ncbi:armadillo-type protein [Aspergillus germanicus]
MAFKNGLSERLDELRFPSPRSPPSETPFPGYSSLSPGHSTFVSSFPRPSGDVRAHLQRRFTTDASKLSSWNYINQVGLAPQAPDALDLLSSFEKKRQHIEYMREQKRRFEEDMKLLDLQHEKEQHEMNQLAKDLAKAGISGPVSEPTTPPEYRENCFPGAFSRPTRFSTSSVTSSPGFFNVFASSVTSPPSQVNHESAQTPTNRFAVHSVPGSRRNSEKEDFGNEPTSPFRPGPSIHRYSMPTTGLGSQIRPNISSFSNSSLETFNTAKYLLHNDDDRSTLKEEDRIPTPDIKSYLKLTEPDDKFPTLSRRDGSSLLSANSDALDLANSKTPNPESWNSHSRHRSSHQSMPQNALNMFRLGQIGADDTHVSSHGSSRHAARHSLEANILFSAEGSHDSMPSTTSSRPVPLQSSYSTNDLPTVKGEGFNPAITPPRTHAEQHNAILSRNLANSITPRQQKDSPEREEARPHNPRAQTTTLQANATPFGPQLNGNVSSNTTAPQAAVPNFQPPFYNYGLQAYMGAPMQVNGQMQPYNPSPSFTGYPSYGNYRLGDSSNKSVASRRNADGESAQLSRFTNYPIDHYRGEIYGLCKDQHGCRYLQRKLEERNPDHVQMIFDETHLHVVELMTDPFGNYLCQKLLEYSNDDQRTALINSAAPQLVKIALNQHGTRALQKMIEFISTSEQTNTVIQSLQDHVVELVQDLNGNHVIQKCLNRLSAEDSQFIYDAVGANCVVVGTHRHGCCVLQRCIDHASGEQRARLIAQITSNAFSLVQDPFGNYVVQYILDLAEAHFTEPLCHAFRGNIPALSKQKFSSNVIEKCLRTAEPPIRRQMIEEMLSGPELEKMLRDSFANYVVQTAMDFADDVTRNRIVEHVRPILPSIRQTPHGRRIASKIMALEGSGRSSAATSGQVTPNEMNSAQLPGPLQAPQNNYMYQQNPFPISAGGAQFGNQSFVPASGTGSTSNTPSGASENSSVIYNSALQQQAGNFGPQGQMYTYF